VEQIIYFISKSIVHNKNYSYFGMFSLR